jgi:hypothetical protein
MSYYTIDFRDDRRLNPLTVDEHDATYRVDLGVLATLRTQEVGPLRSGGQRYDSAGGGGSLGTLASMQKRNQARADAMVEEAIDLDLIATICNTHNIDEDAALARLEAEAEVWAWEQTLNRLDEVADEADGSEPELRTPWWAVESDVDPTWCPALDCFDKREA